MSHSTMRPPGWFGDLDALLIGFVKTRLRGNKGERTPCPGARLETIVSCPQCHPHDRPLAVVHSGGIPRPADKQSNAEMRVGLPIGDEAALIASAADPHWFSAQTLEPSVPARERRKPFVVNHCLYATFPFVPYIPN